jgi:hypothetical protein
LPFRWVVHDDGLDPEATGPLCPGSSAQTEAGCEHVSNAATADGGCDNFDATRARPPVGVWLCGGDVHYLTGIPSEVDGTLYGSIERSTSGGAFVGLTSAADPSAGEAPQIDLDELGCDMVG